MCFNSDYSDFYIMFLYDYVDVCIDMSEKRHIVSMYNRKIVEQEYKRNEK